MERIKSISLTLDEIKALMDIDSAEERQRAIRYVESAMENPDSVNPDVVATEHPAIQRFARRIHRRMQSSRKREQRQPQKAIPARENSISSNENKTAEPNAPIPAAMERIYRKTIKRLIVKVNELIGASRHTYVPSTQGTTNRLVAYLEQIREELYTHLATLQVESCPLGHITA